MMMVRRGGAQKLDFDLHLDTCTYFAVLTSTCNVPAASHWALLAAMDTYTEHIAPGLALVATTADNTSKVLAG